MNIRLRGLYHQVFAQSDLDRLRQRQGAMDMRSVPAERLRAARNGRLREESKAKPSGSDEGAL